MSKLFKSLGEELVAFFYYLADLLPLLARVTFLEKNQSAYVAYKIEQLRSGSVGTGY